MHLCCSLIPIKIMQGRLLRAVVLFSDTNTDHAVRTAMCGCVVL